MAFIANDNIWSAQQIPQVQSDLITIATVIAKYEPVVMLVREQDLVVAKKLLAKKSQTLFPIKFIVSKIDDLWLRDTGPTFVKNQQGKTAAINFNFNGWGEKQTYTNDANVAPFIAAKANVPLLLSELILEGGCFEVDGEGTAIMTESCIINDNRNPNKTKQFIEEELKYLLGLKKIIWLKGIKGKDITDGHTDFYARFAKPGHVVVSREIDSYLYDYQVTRNNIKELQTATDAKGRSLTLTIIDTPTKINEHFGVDHFAAGYIGYYVCNGGIIIQKFGDAIADRVAREKIATLFPHHTIEQIAIDAIASGGGSIHCATQQEPAV